MKRPGTFHVKLVVCMVIAMLTSITVPFRDAQGSSFPNLVLPTMGGKQFWQDTYVQAQWRIQRNILTGHFRLLDPHNTRHAWGSQTDCEDRLDHLKSEFIIPPNPSHLVFLLHGIGRSGGTFSKMKASLERDGLGVVSLSYPSTRAPLEDHAKALNLMLNRLENTTHVSIVTHSMGALVLRKALENRADWNERLKITHIVMIAPPNRGSVVAKRLKQVRAYKLFYGKSGQQLVPAYVTSLPELRRFPFAIIAGGKADGAGFNPFLTGDNDGTVRVAETGLEGAKSFIVVPAIHARISNHPATIEATSNFLKFGQFSVPEKNSNKEQ